MDQNVENSGETMDSIQETGINAQDEGVNEQSDGFEGLRELQVGTQIEVHRIAPQPARGHLGFLMIPADGIDGILTEIKNEWGGGHYQLRAKALNPKSGKTTYIKGSSKVDIAGPSKYQGREYVNGTWRFIEETPTRPPSMPLMQLPTAGGGSERNQIVEALQTIMPLLGDRGSGGFDRLPELIGAMSNVIKPPKERDEFSNMERMLGMLNALKESPLGGGQEKAAEPPMTMESMLPMMMMKMMMGQNQAPPPVPPNPYYPQPPMGAVPQHRTPPQQNWTQAPGYGAQYSVPPIVDPRAQSSVPPPPVAPPVQPSAPPTTTSTESTPPIESEEYEPITVDQLMLELSEKPDAERLEFLSKFCERLGIDEKLMMSMFPNGIDSTPPAAAGFELRLPK